MHQTIKNIFTSLILLFFIGCAIPPTIYFGSPIYGMNKLSQLKQDRSTVQDVRKMLGEPSGYGKMRLKPDSELLDVWCYQYGKFKGSDVYENTVLIFIDNDDIYQGHLAFIANALVEGLTNGN